MRNHDRWAPSKYIMTPRGLRASRNSQEVGVSSRFIADIQAQIYEQLIRQFAAGKLIDLGCGKAPLYIVYQECVKEVVCVDWSGSFHGKDFLDYEFNLNEPIPLPDQFCDTVLVTDVLEHISAPDLFWSEMARLLRDDGRIILGVPFMYLIHEQPYDYARYTEYMLRHFCFVHGLEIAHLSAYGGSPEVVLDMVAKHVGATPIVSLIVLALAQAFTSWPWVKRISKATASKYPLGYALVAIKRAP